MRFNSVLLIFFIAPWLHLCQAHAVRARQLSFESQATLWPDSRDGPLDTTTGFAADLPAKLLPTRTLKARPTTVYRPRSLDALHHARVRSLHDGESEKVEWDRVEVLGPDVEDKHTLSQLARMSGNAYAMPDQKNWYDVDSVWNQSFPFGWEDSDGFRGHVFLSSDNSTIVLSIKGTTLNGPTSKKDKFNDNLLFSCCCARVDISWTFRTVCDCYAHNWRCDDPCLTKALVQDSLFYSIGVKLVNDLRHIYPSSNIWLVGHSLGGALASLLGSTYGLPAVAFEAPGERLAANRLHLPLPRLENSNTSPVAVTHVYHTGDPIPQGTCTGFGSVCAQGGFALETRCHLGKTIVFDTVQKLGWKVDVRRHIIRDVITKVLELDDVEWEEGREVPLAREEVDCVDCFKWEFGHFKDEDEARLL
ncbi:alpha/beta-hydrolase [Lyophyllum atratum]|nr:alpha/beta-hydrolase [Lyophyllum atratum]